MTITTAAGRCIRAMRFVYGDFESLSEKECNSWTPPSVPGTGGNHGRRLWTDAFGVINFVSLFKETGHKRYLTLASHLAQAVRDVLGRTRDGSHRLPGATDQKPLLGGLRSGRSGQHDDGQIYRELTMWMFALDRLGRATDDSRWNALAVELGEAAHPRFTVHKLSGGMRLVGKVSEDTADVVEVERGHIDALVGWAVFRVVSQGAGGGTFLRREIEELERVLDSEEKNEGGVTLGSLGMALWASGLWPDERWSVDLASKGAEAIGRVFEEVRDGVGDKDDVAYMATRELGACLGVKCRLNGGTRGEQETQEAAGRVLRLWEERLEAKKVSLEPEDLGVVGVMTAAVVLPNGFRRMRIGEGK